MSHRRHFDVVGRKCVLPPFRVARAAARCCSRRQPYALADAAGACLRRLKGTSTNLAHARSEATEKRKRTLLQEYRQARAARCAAPCRRAGG